MRPKNWDKFQHYKDRLPPWIKLHREILNDREFMRLPIASKAIAPLMWLLASEHENGEFDGSLENLEFRLHIPEKELKPALKALIEKGFFVDASKPIAPRKQAAIPETETEGEVEGEKEGETEKSRKRIVIKPEDVSEEVWEAFAAIRRARRAPITAVALKGIRKQAELAKMSLQDALSESCSRGWVSFKADWVKTGTKTSTRDENTANFLNTLRDKSFDDIFDLGEEYVRQLPSR